MTAPKYAHNDEDMETAGNLVEVTSIPVTNKEVATEVGLKLMEDNAFRRRARLLRPKWQPKEWHPVYEEIVLLDALGYKNTEIAAEKGFTVVHISNILNTPQAKVIKQIILKRLEAKRGESVETRLEKLTNKAMDRIEEVMTNDTFAAKSPRSIFDCALGLLKSTGKVKDPEAANKTTNNTMIVSEKALDVLSQAISRSEDGRRRLEVPEGPVVTVIGGDK